MSTDLPVVCSLGVADFEQRIAAIAALGAESLVTRAERGGRHLLRFRGDAATRGQLEQIVAAEKECCGFLELSLSRFPDETILSISAPQDAQLVADGLAAAFGAPLS